VWDENTTTKHKLIGRGSVHMHDIHAFGISVELMVPLLTDRSETAGRLVVHAQLEPYVSPEEQSLAQPIAANFPGTGVFAVSMIRAFSLRNTEPKLFGYAITTQDPYIEIKNPTSGEIMQSPVNYNAGQDSSWDVDFEIAITKANLEFLSTGVLEVRCINKNDLSKGGVEIGSGTCKVNRACVAMAPTTTELTVPLKDGSGADMGRIVLFVSLHPPPPLEPITAVADDFTFGRLQIDDIAAFDLKNTEIMGMQDPYLKLNFGKLI
jgi:hypothetical protein